MSHHSRHVVSATAARAFLDSGRLAVIGASDEPSNFGRSVLGELRSHGIAAVAVHPSATTVDGEPAYPAVAAVPGQLDGAIVMVPAEAAVDVVRDCIAAGIPRIWLFKGAGTGALSDEAVRLCEDAGVEVVPGACPLMFLEPVGLVHRIHRGMRRTVGSLTRAA